MKTTNLKVDNLEELKELLQKASNQVEQLEGTLKQIQSFKVQVKTD